MRDLAVKRERVESEEHDAFAAHLADLRVRRDEFRRLRQMPQDVIETWRALGLYRAFVPRELGGSETSASDFLRLIERIAEADGSAGWVASFAFATKYLSSLPASSLKAIYASGPDLVFAGAIYPPQPARAVDDGVVVRGRWKFGSGCTGASLIGVGVSVEGGAYGGLPLMAVIPAENVRIDPTWDTIGMAATGSHDLVVEDVFVPRDFLCVRGGPPSIDSVGYRYPTLAMAAQVLAVTGAGAARAAIDHVLAVAAHAKSITGAPSLADRESVQLHLAECEAKLEAARAWFFARTQAAWERVLAGRPVERDMNMHLRLASSHLAKTSADVARACFEMSGTMGIFNSNPLSRYLTDSIVVAQHAFLTEGTFIQAGRVLLGRERIPGYDQ